MCLAEKHVSGTNWQRSTCQAQTGREARVRHKHKHTHKLHNLVVGPRELLECDPGSESTDKTFSANKWPVKVTCESV
jgi:hypothetical protein